MQRAWHGSDRNREASSGCADHSTRTSLPTWPTWRRRASAAARSRPTTTSSRRSRTWSSPSRPIFIPGKYTSTRQVDGRLGIAPPPHARPRLVHRRSSACAASCTASTSIPATSPATSRRIARSRRSTCRQASSRRCTRSKARRGPRCSQKTALRGNGDNFFADRRSPAVDAPATEHLSRRRRRAAARLRRGRRRLGARRAEAAASSISRRSRTAACSSTRATCTTAPGQPDHARPREEHGRRMGDEAPPRSRPRLGDRPARRAGHRSKVEIDTNHFKGNYPDRASLEGCLAPGATLERARARRRGR